MVGPDYRKESRVSNVDKLSIPYYIQNPIVVSHASCPNKGKAGDSPTVINSTAKKKIKNKIEK